MKWYWFFNDYLFLPLFILALLILTAYIAYKSGCDVGQYEQKKRENARYKIKENGYLTFNNKEYFPKENAELLLKENKLLKEINEKYLFQQSKPLSQHYEETTETIKRFEKQYGGPFEKVYEDVKNGKLHINSDYLSYLEMLVEDLDELKKKLIDE